MPALLFSVSVISADISGKYNGSVADHGIITMALKFSAKFHERFKDFEKAFKITFDELFGIVWIFHYNDFLNLKTV